MAVQLVGSGEPGLDRPSRDGLLDLPESVRRDAVRALPRGKDSELVETALKAGMHVFLTFDKKILRCDQRFRQLGMRLLDPVGLLEQLAACGALHCVISPQKFAAWPVPDLQRTVHLLDALDIE